jgi:hypothetical protein
MQRRIGTERGVTLIEVAVILVVTVTLIGALAPTITAVTRRAELAAATAAMTDIRNQLLVMLNTDLSYNNGPTINGAKAGTKVRRLVSDGDIPREVSATGSALWQSPVDNATGLTDFIERHMISNQPRGSAANAYPRTGTHPWLGAYLTGPVDSDPWGNRYVINTEYIGANSNDVVVYSAGPDEQIDTLYTANPLAAGDDDLILLVEA